MGTRIPTLMGTQATRVAATFETDELVVAALRAGASGFLGKGADPETLLHAIRTVADGESLLSPAATTALIQRFLTQPEPGRTRPHPAWPSSLPGNANSPPWSGKACRTTRSPNACSSAPRPSRPTSTAP